MLILKLTSQASPSGPAKEQGCRSIAFTRKRKETIQTRAFNRLEDTQQPPTNRYIILAIDVNYVVVRSITQC